MYWQILIPGFILGLISSFHCVGMCGPIALLLPVQQLPAFKRTAGILFYNGGRVATYTMIGILFGIAGRRIYIAGFQQVLSIILGSLVLLSAIYTLLNKNNPHNPVARLITRPVKNIIARQMAKKGVGVMLVVGLANGLLPCGMVYFALAGAIATGSITGGAFFMMAFGIGTMPMMMALGYFNFLVGFRTRKYIKRLVPFMILLMGTMLVLRGLNLNIPYISPFLSPNEDSVISCH